MHEFSVSMPLLALFGLACAVLGMLVAGLVNACRACRLADLGVPPDMRIRMALNDFFWHILSDLAETHTRKAAKIARSRKLSAYRALRNDWTAAVGELMRRDAEATHIALFQLKRESVVPYGPVRPTPLPKSTH